MKVILLMVVLLSINIVQSKDDSFEDNAEDDFRILPFDNDVQNDGINGMNDEFQENTVISKTKGLRTLF